MGRGWKSFEVLARKAYIAVNGLGVILVRTERKWQSYRESLSLLREKLSHSEQNVGRNMDSKVYSDVVLDRNEKMRNLLLGTGGKVILVVKCQRTWLSHVCVLVSF